MELELSNQFSCLAQDELENVEGGGAKQAIAVGVGPVAIAWAPVAAFVPGIGLPLAAGMALGGAGLIGKGTGLY